MTACPAICSRWTGMSSRGPLLAPVMRGGRRLPGLETLEQARNRARQLARLLTLPRWNPHLLTRSPYPAPQGAGRRVDREQAAAALG
jgi:hypothetical protein